MRVGLVIYGSLDTLSGGYLYDRKLVKSLESGGHTVEVFSLAFRDYAKHLGDNLDRGWQQRLAAAEVDLLLQDELNHPSLLWANLHTLRQHPRRAPSVSIVHHLRSSELEHGLLLRRIYREIERIYLNSVDALLCNSRTTAASVARLLRRPKPSCVVLPSADHLPAAAPSVSLPMLAARARRDGPLHILFVGNLIRRKNLHVVLDGLGALPAGMWQLSVVGRTDVDHGYTKEITARCRNLPPGTVTFLGRLSDTALVAHYQSHHLLAVPSYEGFGIVYLEAMRFGLPVIAATLGAAREIVTPGANGFLVPPHDSRAVAAAVKLLAANREQLLAMGCAARRTYDQHPTWQQSMAAARHWLSTLPGAI